MADINSKETPARPGEEAIKGCENNLPDPSIIDLIELFFFAYRDFTQDPDVILTEFGFGRAHHRVLHFVNRYPGLRVADLLEILKITKQSLARVLKQLVDKSIIEQHPGKSDRRERRLYVTPEGQKLAIRLMEPQLSRIIQALKSSGIESEQTSRRFLYNMINSVDHEAVLELFSRSRSKRELKG
ncbi:MAG: MarR family transcriptional regulator [bacterium]|nr:MarR family transcriptional regulator [bacterium]